MEAVQVLVSERTWADFGSEMESLGSEFAFVVVADGKLQPEPDQPRILFKTEEISGEEVGRLLGRFPSIEWIQVSSAGLESVLPHLSDYHGTLSNGAGIHAGAIAEWTISMMLLHARDMERVIQDSRLGEWNPVPCRELAGKRLGVIGAGATGRAVARIAVALDMDVVGVRRCGEPVTNFSEIYPVEETDEVLRTSDYVLIAAPLTEQSRGMIGERELEIMRPDAALLNMARGGLVNTDALVRAMHAGQIAGAYLDVTEPEPLPAGHPLWFAPNVVITGHSSWLNSGARRRIFRFFADNLLRWRIGEPLVNLVDPSRNY